MTGFFHYSRLTAFGVFLCILVNGIAYAQEKKVLPDYIAQAAWIRVSSTYFEWPDQAAKSKPYTIRVCVLGDSDIPGDKALLKLYETPPSQLLKLELAAVDSWKTALKSCRILFIDKSEEKKISEIIAGVKGRPLLTFSNMENFISSGGMIEFTTEGANQRYVISPGAIKEAGIAITDPKLLELAKEVR